MLTLVLTVSALVHIYSIEYMAHDKSKTRFMTYLSLFTFCMVALVVSDNLIQLFFGWEGVGLASYLLIGFWHHKKSANLAAMKAFLVNRVADFGFLIGIATLYIFLDTLSINEIVQNREYLPLFQISCQCVLMFCAAMLTGSGTVRPHEKLEPAKNSCFLDLEVPKPSVAQHSCG